MSGIYVGTYAKYNAGNLFGKWLDPEDYHDREAFEEACRELHSDEADPELMFQDWEDIPDGMIGESWVQDELWNWLGLDEDDQQMLAAYCSDRGNDGSIEQARDAFNGVHDTEQDFAEQLFDDCGYLDDKNPLRNYIDWDAVVSDLRMDYSFVRHEGVLYVFRD